MGIGEMITELEEDLEMRKAADIRIGIWKALYGQASDYEKRKMLEVAFKELCGFSNEEIKKIFK